MYQSLIVLDDVLDNAEEVRKQAVGFNYPPRAANDIYPGRNSAQRMRIPALEEAASRVTGERLSPTCDHYGKCRLALSEDDGPGGIHVDECHWSGIYYLSRDEDCHGGTDFYRHKETNSEHAPYTHQHLRDWGYASYEDFVNTVSKPQARDLSKWEHVMRVPMRFNRLILFRPFLWHNAGPGFGSDPRSGRLIHLLFFNNADFVTQAA